jgi:CRISPR system Cascade subunit CasB
MPEYLTKEQTAFIKYLISLTPENNRGTLAILRRGLSDHPADKLNMYRFVARKIPDYDRGTRYEDAYYLTAALYALNPNSTEDGNFGNHMKVIARQRDDNEAAERRFAVLLNTRIDDLNTPLRQAVMMMKQQDPPVRINWYELFADLLHWDNPQKVVQRAWANSFWAYERPTEEADHNPTTNNQ